MAHGVIRTDLMTGTDVGYDLVSVKFVTVDGETITNTAVDNGNIVKLDSLSYDSQRELWKGVAPANNCDPKDLVVIATEEVMYDETKMKNLSDFYVEAGKIARGYRLNGIYSATADAFTIADNFTVQVGNIVELNGTVKPAIVAANGTTAGRTQVGKIIAIETTSRYTYYVVQCDPKATTAPAQSV